MPPVSNLGWVGIGLEAAASPGTAVDSQCYLDAISEGLAYVGGPIRSKAMTSGRIAKKAPMGPYDWQGPITFEVTPDKVTKLIYAVLSSLSTTVTTDPRTHVFKTGSTCRSLTVQVFRPGPDDGSKPGYYIYPGGFPEYLEFRQDNEGILIAEIGLQGVGTGEAIYDAANVDGGIAYSSIDPFVFHELAPSIASAAVTISSDWRIRINTGLIRKRHLANQRGSNKAYAGDSFITGEFQMTWEAAALTEYRQAVGDTADTSPITIGTTVALQDFTLLWTKASNRKLTLQLPKAYYRVAQVNNQGRDQVVTMRGSIEALFDSGTSSDIVATVINSETNANIITDGTGI